MSERDTGGPAFPAQHSIDGNWVKEPLADYTGMSLRDWFAGQALTGMYANMEALKVLAVEVKRRGEPDGYSATAETAYKIADAMLAERNK